LPSQPVIARVTPIRADKYLFVEIETRDGRVGTGEAAAWAYIEPTAAAIEKFGTYLAGQDAERIEHHWAVMRRFGSYSGAVAMAALSAIDMALWDLKGQRLGEPIHALFGGPYRSRIRVYGQAKGRTRDALVASCTALKQAGFTAIGHINPFLDEDAGVPFDRPYAARMAEGVETLAAVRAAIGDDTDMAVEIHRRLRPAEAIAFGNRISHLAPLFYEDPVRPGSVAAMAAVQAQLDIPVATGERLYSAEQFLELLQAGAARYIRPCLGLCGGFTGARRIAAIAAAFDVDLVPHNTYSPVATMASIHFAAATPNLLILEYPTARFTDDVAGTGLMAAELTTAIPVFAAGSVAVGDAPGLGTRLVAGVAALHPYRPIDVGMRAHADGSPIEH
jgi:galactonate dehydratase